MDQMTQEFEDFCHRQNLSTSTDQWRNYSHPLTREYWIVWQTAWFICDDVHQKHGVPKLP